MKRLLPWGACALCLVAVPVGCASDSKANMQTGASATDPGGDSDASPTGGGSNGPAGTNSGNGNGGNGGGSNGSANDAGDPPEPPTPAEPCGTDLDADNGEVRPDLGQLPKGEVFSGDPLQAGKFKVLKQDFKVPNPDAALNPIPLTLYSPSEDGSRAAEGKRGLVLVLPGYGKNFGIGLAGTYPSYSFYSEHLVSHGFVVVGMNFIAGGIGLPLATTENLGAHFLTRQEDNVKEVKAVLDFILSDAGAKAQIDASKIAIAGHSEGGKVAFFAAVEDPRIDLVIGWDPQNAGGGTPCAGAPDTCDRLPIAPICPDPDDTSTANPGRMHELQAETLVFAARDAATIPDAHHFAEHFYRGAPSPAHLVLFADASHENWSDGMNPVSQATMRAQLALLLTRFQGMTGLDDYLPGAPKLVEGIANVEQHSK